MIFSKSVDALPDCRAELELGSQHKQSEPRFQKYLHGIADVLANCLPRFRFNRQHVLPVTHSHKRCLEWMVVDLAADFYEAFGSEEVRRIRPNHVCPAPATRALLQLGGGFFSIEPMVSTGERSAIFAA